MKLKFLFVVLLAGVALSGCHRINPNSSEAERQAIFREVLRTSEDMGGMLHGRLPFDAEGFRIGPVKLHQLADQPWQYFPNPKANEEDEDTRAKNGVWQHQQEFKTVTQVFIDAMNRLQGNTRQATLTPDGMCKDFTVTEDACEACHKKLRAL